MFAVIKTGGMQFRIAASDLVTVPRLDGEAGTSVTFSDVLMLGGGEGDVNVGAPTVSGASVVGEIVEQARGPKVIAFKKRRRKNSRRKRGHRQDLTVVRIGSISLGGKVLAEAKGAKGAPGKAGPKAASAEAAAAAAPADASNLSLISGIGPTIEKKLRAAGVTSWHDIAGWGEAEIAKFDEELKLGGRVTRDEWVEQAKELIAGKPPRAKVDQAELASGEDR